MTPRCLSEPPPDEVVLEIPPLSDELILALEKLKKVAFEEFLANYGSGEKMSRSRRTKVADWRRISGFTAFKTFLINEFYGIPQHRAARLYSKAWNACDQRYVWEYYANQYRKFIRDVPFDTWLRDVSKEGDWNDELHVRSKTRRIHIEGDRMSRSQSV